MPATATPKPPALAFTVIRAEPKSRTLWGTIGVAAGAESLSDDQVQQLAHGAMRGTRAPKQGKRDVTLAGAFGLTAALRTVLGAAKGPPTLVAAYVLSPSAWTFYEAGTMPQLPLLLARDEPATPAPATVTKTARPAPDFTATLARQRLRSRAQPLPAPKPSKPTARAAGLPQGAAQATAAPSALKRPAAPPQPAQAAPVPSIVADAHRLRAADTARRTAQRVA